MSAPADMNLAPSPSAEPPYAPCQAAAHPSLKFLLIPLLVMVGVFALFLLHVLGTLRRRSSHKVLHAVVLGVHTLSYTLVSYTLGLMQHNSFFFDELPVWAVSLLMLLGGTDNLMACSLNDLDNWKRFHMRHLFKGGLVVYIVAAYGFVGQQVYLLPVLLIIVVNLIQSYVRINSMRMANKSERLRKNLKPIADYMKHEDSGQPIDLPDMKGYRYVVAGEHMLEDYLKQQREGVPRDGKLDGVKLFTTVEQIWDCKGSLLECERGSLLKDVCLSMALSKMLNRRFAGLELAEAGLTKTNDFVFQGLLAKDKDNKRYERPFRVIEVELGFVYDLYYTRYPYLYHKGRYLALCLPLVMVILCSWLTYELFDQLFNQDEHDGFTIDTASLGLTLVLMAVVTFLEAFQLYLHMASGWFKVDLIRSYVTRPALQGSTGCFLHMIMGFLLRFKAHRPWENKLGQYSLLQNYDHRTINFLHYVTLGLADKTMMGRKRGKPVKLSTDVKQAVVDSLIGSNGGQLMNGVRSLRNNGVHKKLSRACDGSVTRTILVWHVATTICKHKLDAAYGKHGSNQHRTMRCCRRSPKKHMLPELSEEDNMAIHKASSVASDLSHYCAYLVAFAPDLLPDHSFDSAAVLDNAIMEARKLESLRDVKTVERKCEILMTSFGDYNDNDARIVIVGAWLARQLMTSDMVLQWKVLSDFWAEMMLYVAPCDDAHARDHLEALARGGEFITHLWALLTHAGVLGRGAAV